MIYRFDKFQIAQPHRTLLRDSESISLNSKTLNRQIAVTRTMETQDVVFLLG